MLTTKLRLSCSDPWSDMTRTSLTMLACTVCACSSGSGNDGGSGIPGTAVQVSIAPSNQAQSVQLPQQSGPITGTLGFPPITAPTSNGGNLTLSVLSGTNVAFESAGPATRSSSSATRRASSATQSIPLLLEGKLTAPFDFVTEAPGLNIDLNSIGLPRSVPYTFAVQATPGGLTFEYPVVAGIYYLAAVETANPASGSTVGITVTPG
jgi:hypothetical protein